MRRVVAVTFAALIGGVAFACFQPTIIEGLPCGSMNECPPDQVCHLSTGTCHLNEIPCGNGSPDPGEDCDDGNQNYGDGCRPDCTVERCGDMLKDVNELCDDGNTESGDGCRSDCQGKEECGDSFPDEGELCDDGNLINGDGCRSNCTIEACGDGVVDATEACYGFTQPLERTLTGLGVTAPNPVMLADFTGNAEQDVLVALRSFEDGRHPLELLLYPGDGTSISTTPQVSTVLPDLLVVDAAALRLDANASLDLVLATTDSLILLSNDGAGNFATLETKAAGLSNIVKLAAGQLNGDSVLDIVTLHRDPGNGSGFAQVFFGDGLGGLSNPTQVPAGDNPSDLVIAEMNGIPGNDLLIVGEDGSGELRFFSNDGSGGIVSPPSLFQIGSNPRAMIVFDLDGVGGQDLAISTDSGLEVLAGGGTGGFTRSVVTDSAFLFANGIVAGDIDSDGDQDLALMPESSNPLVTYRNEAGVMTRASVIDFPDLGGPFGQDYNFIVGGHIDSDARIDIVLATDVSGDVSTQSVVYVMGDDP
jgi:cysteine-rich repeat protein